MGRTISQNGRMKECFKNVRSKPTGKIPLGRPRRRWEDNIIMNFKEIGINLGIWVDLAQDRYSEPL